MIVRHPFDRLVSAFRDKLERIKTNQNMETHYYYKLYGKDIVKTYRARAIENFGKEFFGPENNFGAPMPVKGE